jgi:4-hydroxybenzoate polyprenyltransferase
MIACMVFAGIVNRQGLSYFALSCGGTALHLVWQIVGWDVNNAKQGGQLFMVRTTGLYIPLTIDQELTGKP